MPTRPTSDTSGDRSPVDRFRLDRRVRRSDRGRTVVGGAPRRMLRLTDAGAELLDRLDAGSSMPAGAAARRLLERLLETGVVHPAPAPRAVDPDEVTLVVPVRDRPEQLERLLDSVDVAGGVGHAVVVDDGSIDPEAHAEVCRRFGATMLRRDEAGGPAAARNAGIAAARTRFVACVDSDVEVDRGWLEALRGHLDDPRVAVVAPRVEAVGDAGTIARYEAERSPLDLGVEPAIVGPGRRVTYVPAAAVFARRDAVMGVGGFDESLAVGEDVDLVWRLVDAGWIVRYEPAATVRHAVLPDLAAIARRRVAYGSSAALLDARHPGRVAPLRTSPWSLAAWGAVLAGHPLVGGATAFGTAAALRTRLPESPDRARVALRLGLEGHLSAGAHLARSMLRPYWPLVLLLALRRPGWAARLVAAAAVAAFVDRRPADGAERLPWWRYVPLALADDVAYGTGVWRGALAARRPGALRPRLT